MFHRSCSRRSFLKASVLGTLMLFSGKPAFPKELITRGFPEGRLSLHNTHTGENLTATYRKSSGEYDLAAIDSLNWILRCHYTNEATEMDIRVIEYLNMVDKSLGGNNTIHIISGFRSPEYNNLLVKRGRGVARHSLHLQGKAVDIAIAGIPLDTVRQTALSLRQGGVGYYPWTGFVHLDSGRFRSW